MTAAPRIEPLPESQWDPELSEIFGRESDGGLPTSGKVLNIFRTLAHHPKLLKRWTVFGNHVLFKSTLRAARARADHPAHRLALPLRVRVGTARAHRTAGGPHRRGDLPHPDRRRRAGLERQRRRSAPRHRRAPPRLAGVATPPGPRSRRATTSSRCSTSCSRSASTRWSRWCSTAAASCATPASRASPPAPRAAADPLTTRWRSGSQDKVAVVVGAGQTPGDTIGNGRATAILFAREGARVAVRRPRPRLGARRRSR